MKGSGQGVGSGPEGSMVRAAPRGWAKRVRTCGARWSAEAERLFLDALAASCNVKMAAEEAGFSTQAIYKRRRRCAAFAERFDAARDQGFVRLEMELIRTAADSMEGIEFDAERPIPKMTVDEAMWLLKAHKLQVLGLRAGHPNGRPYRRKTFDEVRASVIRKVEAIKRARDLE